MFKLILRNLWSRRKRNGWLLAELIIVAIVIWVVIDPVVVRYYCMNLPLNYDADRLYVVDFRIRPSNSPRYDKMRTDSASQAEDFARIVNRIRSLTQVESVTPLPGYAYIESRANTTTGITRDSVWIGYNVIQFSPGTGFFTTYGFKSAGIGPSVDELSAMSFAPGDMVVTRAIAEALYPDSDPIGKYVNDGDDDFKPDENSLRIVGVVENVRNRSYENAPFVAFTPYAASAQPPRALLVRVKPGVSYNTFSDVFQPLVPSLESGNIFVSSAGYYPEIIASLADSHGITGAIRLKVALAVLFFLNLCLGVIGTFYLQTRKRSEEAGIMRSYGATPGYIVRMLLGEGWVLTTVGWLIGCLIYLQYAYAMGLERSQPNEAFDRIFTDWTTSFGHHFAIVSLIVYVFMVVVVSVGISIPAYRISHVDPVNALRDE